MLRYLRFTSALKLRSARAIATRPAIFNVSAAEPQKEAAPSASMNWDLSYLDHLPNHKVVGDVVDEHLASEAAAAAKYTRVVSSGGGQVNTAS